MLVLRADETRTLKYCGVGHVDILTTLRQKRRPNASQISINAAVAHN